MTKIQEYLATLPEEKKELFAPVFGTVDKFYVVVYLVTRNEHITDQEKPDRYEDRLQVIRQIRSGIKKTGGFLWISRRRYIGRYSQ